MADEKKEKRDLELDRENAIFCTFAKSMKAVSAIVHIDNVKKGFWDDKEIDATPQGKSSRIMLTVTELAEAVEAIRKPDRKDEHLPDEDAVGLELADAVIRIMDYCDENNIDLGDLITKKTLYNRTRAHKHGGKVI